MVNPSTSPEDAAPLVSIRVSIEPQTLVLAEPIPTITDETPDYLPLTWQQQPILSLTVTSYATRPITIFTWYNILLLEQNRLRYTCHDLTSNTTMELSYPRKIQRFPFSRTRGDSDERLYCTFYPGVPTTFTTNFGLAYSTAGGLQPGHRYRFGVREGQEIDSWWYGTKDDILLPPGVFGDPGHLEPSGPPIQIQGNSVEFEVV